MRFLERICKEESPIPAYSEMYSVERLALCFFRTGFEQQATVSIRERRRITRGESHGVLVALPRAGVSSRHV